MAPKKMSVGASGGTAVTAIPSAAIDPLLSPLLLTVPQTGDLIGVSRAQVYKMLETKQLECVKIGKLLRVKASSIRAFVDSLPLASVKGGAGSTKLAA